MYRRMSVRRGLIYLTLILPAAVYAVIGIDGPLTNREALEDGNTTLYCDTTTAVGDDEVMLLVWYKGDESIYSYDARTNTEWSIQQYNVSSRLSIDRHKRPTPLFISALRDDDQALYRCRVEFLLSPTKYTKVLLTVIVLPSKPFFLDEMDNKVENKIGPYFEGDTLVLKCLVIGGRPPPQITWYSGDVLVDASSGESDIPHVRQNELFLPLTRDNTDNLSCKASNTKLSPPISSKVDIELYLTASKVSIDGIQESFQSGKAAIVQCTAYEVYPAPDISWWLDHKHLTQYSNQTWNHATKTSISFLQLSLSPADNNATLACVATNPAIPSKNNSKADIVTLNVTYVPIVEVTMHKTGYLNGVIENDILHLTCDVNANPPVEEFLWYFNDSKINKTFGWDDNVYSNNLIIKKVNQEHKGQYSCSAKNSVGETKSEHIDVMVFYAPKCIENGITQVNETIICKVTAMPEPKVFTWLIEADEDVQRITSESAFIPLAQITVSLTKTLNITCKANNDIAIQEKSCNKNFTFKHLRPQPPQQCDLAYENRQFQIRCIPVKNATHYEVTVWRKSPTNGSLVLDHRSVMGFGGSQTLILNVDGIWRIAEPLGILDRGDEAGAAACNKFGCSETLLLRPTENLLSAAKIQWWHFFLDKDVGISIGGSLLVIVFVISSILVICAARRSRVKQPAPVIQVLQIDDVTREFINSTKDLKARSSSTLRTRSRDYLNSTDELCLTNWRTPVLHDVDPPPDVTLTLHRESAV
ncbi:muscle M-line assembly protein unc-89-like [Battus philenor]|uniref:muscle M-line assembly protein unc-89-like n=1 Tax=Battus philenor TaxID=42288 RepID=UPI0035CEDF17